MMEKYNRPGLTAPLQNKLKQRPVNKKPRKQRTHHSQIAETSITTANLLNLEKMQAKRKQITNRERIEKIRINQNMGSVTMNPLFRSESFGYYNYYFPDQNYTMIEKRQLFLRSYQFCRKKSLTERIKGSLVRAKKVVLLKLRFMRHIFNCSLLIVFSNGVLE
ncbi:hypothetical protein P8452_48661 [Trifolium repens]|nr:hypothetical protein P8452_48661 [Trifolium repens]